MRRKKTIKVYPAVIIPGSAGQDEVTHPAWPKGDPALVRCNVRPLDTEEIQFWGDHGRDMRTVFADTWPGDINSILTLDGERWDQVAPAKTFDYGASTQHVEVVIRKR